MLSQIEVASEKVARSSHRTQPVTGQWGAAADRSRALRGIRQVALPYDSFVTGRLPWATSLQALSRAGASAE
jgi:hypothetical protein